MKGREDSVIERFRKDLRRACRDAKKIDMNAPLNGADRYVNADEFFAVDGRFFMVEFKSSRYNLKFESRKASACDLCSRLQQSHRARALHDRGHFAAWGRKQTGALEIRIGVYRVLVCCESVLPNCAQVKGLAATDEDLGSDEILKEIVSEQAGLTAEEFKSYLQWLLSIVENDGTPGEFPLTLFGYSYADGVFDMEFQSYVDFDNWASAALANVKEVDSSNRPHP